MEKDTRLLCSLLHVVTIQNPTAMLQMPSQQIAMVVIVDGTSICYSQEYLAQSGTCQRFITLITPSRRANNMTMT